MTKANSIQHLENWLGANNESRNNHRGDSEYEYWHQRSHALKKELDRLYALEGEIRCQEGGCTTKEGEADVYEVPDTKGEPPVFDYYCSAHATKAGYCVGCGGFYGGIESFELEGMCENCIEDEPDNNDNDYMEYAP